MRHLGNKLSILAAALLVGRLLLPELAFATGQAAPDTGSVLKEQSLPPKQPAPTVPLRIDPYRQDPVQPGGPKVKLESLTFLGNSVFSAEVLGAAVKENLGKEFDLAGLQKIADSVADFYRTRGYPFARVILPPQTLSSGRLKIEVVEGRFGQVTVDADAKLKESADRWLSQLKPGEVIREKKLERATLVLQDQPGISIRPLIKPGDRVGTGDLDVKVSPNRERVFDLGVDNYGSRFTGRNRLRASGSFSGLTTLGDQLQISALRSDADLSLGSVTYSRPLGYSGLRATVGVARTTYMLAPGISIPGTGGKADVLSTGLSYPLIRSNAANLSVNAGIQKKNLRDFNELSVSRKLGYAVPLSAQFDVRDSFLSPAITYGSVSLTVGHLTYRDNADNTAGTAGGFRKLNFDIVRQQQLPHGMLLSARLSVQSTTQNLDSSEDFVLGGPYGVRAYPTGEASGDRGWLTQLEMRRRVGITTPYVFFDYGRIDVNARVYSGSLGPVSKERGGGGLGLRVEKDRWVGEAALAIRTVGGKPESETDDSKARAWINAGYRF